MRMCVNKYSRQQWECKWDFHWHTEVRLHLDVHSYLSRLGTVSHISLLIPAWSPFRRRANVLFQASRVAQVQIASLYRLLTDGVNTAQTTTNQAGYYVYRSLSKLQKVLYFSNIWGVKESVSRRGRILNKQRQWDKRKKRVKKRQQCWGRFGRCGRFQTPNLRETARQRESERERGSADN